MAAAKNQWWQGWGNAAQITSALVAIFGFGAVLLQLNEIRQSNRAASARQVYLGYADLEFKNPQFADPDYEQIKAADRDTRTRYASFVSYLLYACEEAFAAFSDRTEWQKSCNTDLKPHLPFLCEKSVSDSGFLQSFSVTTQNFVRAAMARAGVAAPTCKMVRS